jgi:hypothetical protein
VDDDRSVAVLAALRDQLAQSRKQQTRLGNALTRVLAQIESTKPT